ncbi:MAG: DUF4124 domain-containing protein [Ahniella sp.]|nr:DUF4124 domain-containing protein [Ahniella sp.]
MRTLLVLVMACLVAGPAYAGKKFYKWQDEQGAWHYTEKQPAGQAAASVNVSDKAPDVSEEEPADGADAAAKVPDEYANDAAAQRIVAGRQEACERARKAVAVYEENAEVTVDLDKDGRAEVLTTQQHLEQMTRAREQAESYCN